MNIDRNVFHMPRTNEQPLKEVIDELLEAYHLTDRLNETEIIQSWTNIMGNVIAKHTTNIYIYNKILHVSLDSSALREELFLAKSKIIKMLTKKFKKPVINDIIFK